MNSVMHAVKATLKGLFAMFLWVVTIITLVVLIVEYTAPVVTILVTVAILYAAHDIGKAI